MSVILKESHEKLFLQEGHFLACGFREGWVAFQILGREPSNLKPYKIESSVKATSEGSWNEIIDSASRRYLEPPYRRYIYHAFWGVRPPEIRVYFQYPTREDRWSLTEITRSETGPVGYIDGYESPFNGPFSPRTEIFTFYDLYPAFKVYNPTSYTVYDVLMSFSVMKYKYQIIKDLDTVRDLVAGERRCKKYIVGGIDRKAPMPRWLQDAAVGAILVFEEEYEGA